jgi:hypothetical protein
MPEYYSDVSQLNGFEGAPFFEKTGGFAALFTPSQAPELPLFPDDKND